MSVYPEAPASRPDHAAALDLRVLRALPFAAVCVAVSALGHCIAGGGAIPLDALLLGGIAVWAVAAALAGRERSLPSIAAGLAVGQLGLHLLFHQAAMSRMAAMPAMPAMPAMAGVGGMTGSPSAGGSGAASALDALAARLICGPDGSGSALALPPGTTAGQIISQAGLDPHLSSLVAPHLPFWTHAAFLGLSPLMMLGHLTAALTAGWWLRRGEAAVWRLIRLTAQVTETLAQTWTAPLRTLLALATALLRGLLGALGTPDGTARLGTRDTRNRRLPRAALLRHQVVRRGPPLALAA
ncbi:hypothetical protein [Streptacidiphilus sp. MAP12-16]|uniref:hypothetical protein n=1 Tax=Streptacidiphilus sp. MAP12-16 TaxID=3156300 RepID=UPI00351575BA